MSSARAGVVRLVALAILGLALAGPPPAGASAADGSTDPTTTASEPAPTSATTASQPDATTLVETTAPAPTPTAPTATAPAATAAATPSTTAAASTAAGTSSTPASARGLVGHCMLGSVALILPGRAPLVLGPVAQAPRAREAALSRLAYPANGSVVTAAAISLAVSGCGPARLAIGSARLRSLSLFAGGITATAVTLRIAASAGRRVDLIDGLRVDGRSIRAAPGARVKLGRWGYLVVAAPGPSALAVHLLDPRVGLPAGTVVLVSFAGLDGVSAGAASAKKRTTSKASGLGHRPLKATPPLGLHDVVFPVVGRSDFADTFGAFRGDVPGNWHHGDDIFAPLGTPVVAVADGTLNRVGWEKIGGWRLWVRDDLGDEFYYAHLSGYSPAALHATRVTAGEVIGFVGNTGDAFTTSPHLHFEVHPRVFLHLNYDGAVDPTTYLDHWKHLDRARAPRPVHPALPAGAVRVEARYVFRELLAARHLIKRAPGAAERPVIRQPGADGDLLGYPPGFRTGASRAAPSARSRSMPAVAVELAAGSLALIVLATVVLLRRRGRLRGRMAPEAAEDA
jgi:murein DD-endopeptidase MepM/ murein hydrolase activator NlpD